MSLVGTRPPTAGEYAQYSPHHKRRLSLKPGITGMWQVSGRSDITDIEVLKNAIDSQNFIADADTRNEIRKELGLKDKFVVGHVGRLHPQKNHDFLIDVFAELKKKKPDAELILVGTGPLEEKVKSKVVEKGLSDCVHFLGNRKDMNRIYQAMDVFVFPSLFEGLGIVAIEAQAAGVPIVCSEGLPPETDITPIYRKLLLSDGAEKWANAALEMAQNPSAHTNMQKYVIDAGFDICSFDSLKFKHKVIFTVKEYPQYRSAYYIPKSEVDIQNVKNLCDYQSRFTRKRWLDEFDWISFLNER